ncbi:MAG: complement resistance protein TraT [Geminicoccaceae bacterium]|nr:complement resistance protein TraT [Geminicoccaceae bacterium]
MDLRITIIASTAALMLTGCAATSTSIAKRNLDVQTKMSDTIFIDPVRRSSRLIYIEVRNTSDKQDLEIENAVRSKIADHGYRVTTDPGEARFMLQANVLQAGKSSKTAADEAYEGGFGSVLAGGAAGAAAGWGLGQAGGNDGLLIAGGALLGAGISSVADAFVQDVTYSIITDIQVSERAAADEYVSQDEQLEVPRGESGRINQYSSGTSEWKRYRSRVVSTANQVNLDWPDAAPQLVEGLSRSIAGIF